MRIARLLCTFFVALSLACEPDGSAPPTINDGQTPITDDPGTPSEPSPSTGKPPRPKPPTPPPPPQPEPHPPSEPEEQRPFALPQVQEALQEYELILPPGVLEMFLADKYTPEQDAIFRHNGVSYPVKVRLRGASARDFPKKSWNVSFEDGVRFEDRTSLNLVAEYQDASMLAEKLAYDLLAAMRVPAPRAKYVRLSINGRYEGVFLDIEQVNKSFLRAHDFADRDATIYRAGWKDTELKLRSWKVPYQGDWQQKTNEKTPHDEALDAVLYVINRTPEPELPDALARHLDLEGYLRSMVMDALMSNNYIEDSESYFIHDEVADRWVYVAWDLNNVDARWWHEIALVEKPEPLYKHPLFPFTLTDGVVATRYENRKTVHPGYLPVFSNLGTRVVVNPELRARLVDRIDKAMNELFTLEVLGAHIDKLHALLTPHMADDPYMDFAKFQAGRAWMRDYVRLRRAFVLKELERYRASKPGLVLEALDTHEGWVELGNRGDKPVSLGGMVLTTNLRRSIPALLRPEIPAEPPAETPTYGPPQGVVLAERMLNPGERVRFTAAELGLTFTPDGEIGVFDGRSVVGLKDVLFYGKLLAGKHYERAGDGAWEVR
ncbi:Inner spore coat protein H [Archangium violaceum]|uniref:CotH kinase family protein n=1 Tax=Archangium violaceum TaxID=83451 RepID=UPI002B2C9262|nr:Inner spore coat protein H [Archangium violaceum]